MRRQILFIGVTCFAAGWFCGGERLTLLQADPAPAKNPFPMSARLGCNIFLQRSAEYRACCYQAFQSAENRIESLLIRSHPKPAKPAVVMDLDETVFDNSAFQTFLYQNDLEYTEPLWADYEANYSQDVTLIPGAKAFIEKAESLGVTVIYISNRSEVNQAGTEKALTRLGLAKVPLAGRVLLKPKGGSSDKSHRREAVAAKHNVLLYFGDNLRDFSESFAAPKLLAGSTPEDYLTAIQKRELLTDEARVHWGIDWFVLPNPVYGEWDKLIGPDPLALMHPTSMPSKAK